MCAAASFELLAAGGDAVDTDCDNLLDDVDVMECP